MRVTQKVFHLIGSNPSECLEYEQGPVAEALLVTWWR